jgi:hypothetical protein
MVGTIGEIKDTPWDLIKDLLKLIDLLENDENAFLGPADVAGFKNLLRRFKKPS